MNSIKKNNFVVFLFSVALSLFSPSIVFAHTAITPAEVEKDSFQTFTLATHPEKNSSLTKIRLVIPDGVNYVTPYIKAGWKTELVKEKDTSTEKPRILEIIWSGGNLAPDFHDEFSFIARVPNTETKLTWKVYQTFADGTVLSWDLNPDASSHDNHDDTDGHGFSSQTKVIQKTTENKKNYFENNNLAILLSVAALLISLLNYIYKRK